jgi:hypothetical protein
MKKLIIMAVLGSITFVAAATDKKETFDCGNYNYSIEQKAKYESTDNHSWLDTNIYERQLSNQEYMQELKSKCDQSMLPGVKIGMTAKTVREKTSWGEPNSINRSVGKWGVHEQWVYEGGDYLYFENGKLTSLQN